MSQIWSKSVLFREKHFYSTNVENSFNLKETNIEIYSQIEGASIYCCAYARCDHVMECIDCCILQQSVSAFESPTILM